jgi:Zn-dependent protease with chaperone function
MSDVSAPVPLGPLAADRKPPDAAVDHPDDVSQVETPPSVTVDPFLLPAGTDAHFVLLLVSVVGASILLFTLTFNSIGPLWDAKTANEQRCQFDAEQAVPDDSFAANVQRNHLANACEAPILLLEAASEVGGVIVLLAVTLGLYWWLPKRSVRRLGLRRLRTADAPGVVEAVQALSLRAGLRQAPELAWNPLNRASGGVAFGHWGRRYLGLYGGTYFRLRRKPQLFEAVALHELAHIRNADLDKAGLAVTVWWAFLATALLPATAAILIGGRFSPSTPIAFGWRLVALAGLVGLTRAAVLRTRELFADARAAGWAGGPDAMLQAVGELRPAARSAPRWRLPAVLVRGLALHPSVAERSQALLAPAALFRTDYWAAFATGAAVTLALENLNTLLEQLMPDQGELAGAVSALALAPLAVAVVALPIWRKVVYARIVKAAADAHSAIGLGLAFGAGLFVGWHLSLAAYALDSSTSVIAGGQRLTFELVFAVYILGCMAVFVAWLTVCASAWTNEIEQRARPLRRALLAAVVAGALILIVWLDFTNYAIHGGLAGLQGLGSGTATAQLADIGIPAGISPEMSVVVEVFGFSLLELSASTVTLLALALVWAFPLAAARLRGARHPSAPALRVRPILIGAVAGGLLTVPLLAAQFLVVGADANPFQTAIVSLVLFAVAPTLVGVLVARGSTWLGPLQGLCAAQLGGLLAAGIIVLIISAAGVEMPSSIWLSMLNGGTIVAGVPIMLAGSRRTTQPGPQTD